MLRIKELRQKAGLTQQELAEAVGVNRPALAMWEIGKSWPSAQILPEIAAALKCSVEDLYSKNHSTIKEECPCTESA